ncbi:MAG: hypothetical protein NTX50_22215 [Candidatus Sumerlaeota bacterium]|nr:hypothetical protein [Candidatus Sumerlaeota bacterium]
MSINKILVACFFSAIFSLSSAWPRSSAPVAPEAMKAEYNETATDVAARLDSLKDEIEELKKDVNSGEGSTATQSVRRDLLRDKEALVEALKEFSSALKTNDPTRIAKAEARSDAAEVAEQLQETKLELYMNLQEFSRLSDVDIQSSGAHELILAYLDKCKEQMILEKQKNKLEKAIDRLEDEKAALQRRLAPSSTTARAVLRRQDGATSTPRALAIPDPGR